jgi:tRNA-guanine transglycosylase
VNTFQFQLTKTSANGRAGSFTTAHGIVQTPIFMPVGTQATDKSLDTQDIEELNAEIILANTYHLYLRPGMDVLKSQGGVHKFMGWEKPMLTDSGGFQVFSLGKQIEQKMISGELPSSAAKHGGPAQPFSRITDEGVEFTSHLDGSRHFFSPEGAIEIQRAIGADIIMAFDECTPDQADEKYTLEALDRTHRWAAQCKAYWDEQHHQSVYGTYQALFGIIQGAQHPELRKESAKVISALGFDGIAVGGETVGYNMAKTVEIMDWIREILPEDKPRYAMGLGRDPQNLLDAVQAGFDMFDCVAPTRLARNGALYVGELDQESGRLVFRSDSAKGRLQIGNHQYMKDSGVIQAGCDCATCSRGYTRAYLNHLYRSDELTYYRLASIHNVRFMVRLSQQIRNAILRG